MGKPCGILNQILAELSRNAKLVDEDEVRGFAEAVKGAERIFVAGAGRSGFVARAFSNRLMHLGMTVFFVGEPTTPAIGPGDLLVVLSGSGETGSLVVMTNRAKKAGAQIATVTIYPGGAIGRQADAVVRIPGGTPKSGYEDTAVSCQPMGNAFEQMSWLVFDTVVAVLMELLNRSEAEMFRLHANLE